jgi:NADPH2:quinone reductase
MRLRYSTGRKTTLDITDLEARMAGFSLFAQSPTTIAAACRDILPLIANGSVTPKVVLAA